MMGIDFQTWFYMAIIGVLGFGLFRGCEAGCSYVRDHVEINFVESSEAP